MRPVHTVEEVRAAEGALMARLPPGTLMQRAATGIARRAAQLLGGTYGARVTLLVGKGDNGGDALFAGARLARRGARVTAVTVGESAHEEGLAALAAAGGRVTAARGGDLLHLLDRADLVVDGVLGIGGHGGLRGPAAQAAAHLATTPTPVLAVDVPSGVDAGSGRVDGVAVRADVTVTFGAVKPGLLVDPGAGHAGTVECVDIGLGPFLPAAATGVLDAADVAGLLPVPTGDTNKYRRGVLGVLAGSERFTGAAVLAVGGAIRAGAGMVRFVGVPHAAETVRARWPEAVVTTVPAGPDGTIGDPDAVLGAGQVQAWVVGSGLGTDDGVARVLRAVLGTELPVLVDADAITILAADDRPVRDRSAPTLLTPHAGEFARLTGADRADVEAGRLDAARTAARGLGATVLLKGRTTVVCDPDGTTRINPTGIPWLATAGSGDVLSGACGALLAGGLTPLDAGAAGSFLHGLAARLAAGDAPGAPVAAEDLVTHWATAVRAVQAPG